MNPYLVERRVDCFVLVQDESVIIRANSVKGLADAIKSEKLKGNLENGFIATGSLVDSCFEFRSNMLSVEQYLDFWTAYHQN